MRLRRLGGAFLGMAVTFAGLAGTAPSALADGPATERLAAYTSTGNFDYTISGDNQRVLLSSGAALIPGDTDPTNDIYLVDVATKAATLVSVDCHGDNVYFGYPNGASMSADAGTIVFASDGYCDENMNVAQERIYLSHGGGPTTPITEDQPGVAAVKPKLTPDGRYVVYERGLFGSNDTAVIRQDIGTGETVTIADHGHDPSISDDGTTISYWNSSNGIDSNPDAQGYAATVAGGVVTTRALGGVGTARTVVAPDGSAVAFQSTDASLAPGLVDGFGPWIFLRNLTTDSLEVASRRSDGLILGHSYITDTSQAFSAAGRYFTFLSDNPAATQDYTLYDQLVRDLTTGRTTIVSFDNNETQFDYPGAEGGGILSADGSTVVFGGRHEAYVRHDVGSPNRAPSAAVTAFNIGGLQFQLNASASSDPDTHLDLDGIVRYEWDFDGNGTIDDTTTVPSDGHTYAHAGHYIASVRVTDHYGLTDTATVVVNANTQYGNAVLADHPDSYYRLGEASGPTATDEIGAHNGTFSGAVTTGVPGATNTDTDTAAHFDGIRSAVDLTAPTTALGTNFSIEAWVRTSATDKQATIVSETKGSAIRALLNVDPKSGSKLRFQLHDDAKKQAVVLAPTAFNDGQYHYVVAVRRGNTMALYVDTNLVASKALPAGFGTVTVDKATIGAKRIAGVGKFSAGFTGDVDEVALYSSTGLDIIQMINHRNAAIGGGGGGGF